MSRTRFLVAIAVAVLLMQFLPNQANTIKWIVIALGVLYLAVQALRTYPRQFREKRVRAAQQAADEREYQRYKLELDSIRAKYDPRQELLGNVELPQEFKDELTALHGKYQAMLDRKFGAREKPTPAEPAKSYK